MSKSAQCSKSSNNHFMFRHMFVRNCAKIYVGLMQKLHQVKSFAEARTSLKNIFPTLKAFSLTFFSFNIGERSVGGSFSVRKLITSDQVFTDKSLCPQRTSRYLEEGVNSVLLNKCDFCGTIVVADVVQV